MKLFSDSELKQEIDSINFGKVKVGESKTVKVYVYNDSEGVLTNLEFSLDGKGLPPKEDLKIIEAPTTIQPKTAEPLVVQWAPSAEFKKGLSVQIKVQGEVVYLSEEKIEVTREVHG